MSSSECEEDVKDNTINENVTLEELKPDLVPIKNGSKFLIPKSDADPIIGQKWLRLNVDNKIRILCTDGRLFEGIFHCIDSSTNIILKECHWINAGASKTDTKPVGQALFGRSLVKTVYFKTPNNDDDNTKNNTNSTQQNDQTSPPNTVS